MKQLSNRKILLILLMLVLTLIVSATYSIVRVLFFFQADYGWPDMLISLLLLMAEFFILVHGVGYFFNIIHILFKKLRGTLETPSKRHSQEVLHYPPVAIVVAAYKEPLFVLQNTLTCFYNLTYPNKHLYLLDDTRYDTEWAPPAVKQAYKESINEMCKWLHINVFRRKWHHAKAGIINDFVSHIYGEEREGFELLYFEEKAKREREKYLIVFDADMNPLPNFVGPLLDAIESDPRIAFVQTPQYYSNFEFNRVARASSLMHAVFYEYICEAKGVENAMFCCGTNFIMRLDALKDVGGFDQVSVTEDFATSFKLHKKAWKSRYINLVCSFGLGPEDLGAFFKQQYRWAFGTLSMFKTFIADFIRHPFALSFVTWWQYFLSASYYFIGIVFFVMMICPIIYIFFNIPSYFQNPWLYTAFFGPYLLMTNLLFYWTLRQRHYTFNDLFIGVILIGVTFPVYLKAAIDVMLGKQMKFVTTPKGVSASLSLKDLWPQILSALVCFSAIVWAGFRLYYEREPFYAILINAIWVAYYFFFMCFVFYFNKPLPEQSKL